MFSRRYAYPLLACDRGPGHKSHGEKPSRPHVLLAIYMTNAEEEEEEEEEEEGKPLVKQSFTHASINLKRRSA